ncbi:hypothetical protein HBI56_146250 [Parastagonospora nodorum]|nr:hypothetical protein HBH53_049520 [Parastagonospora nodorum]KAH3981727.1 hypothetical protein HBH51_045500 [Parastagonospora nodorum]KAH3982965.1 hypothetical protein HBH52_073510 [Parastagonospora nodorum]KAH3995732.1 hypothetical protein HBI10_167110 [Parastagonospora nodorum]KAH4010304.1 hypothetical protein HBI09_232120 [Parastagonospora nodorum]
MIAVFPPSSLPPPSLNTKAHAPASSSLALFFFLHCLRDTDGSKISLSLYDLISLSSRVLHLQSAMANQPQCCLSSHKPCHR